MQTVSTDFAASFDADTIQIKPRVVVEFGSNRFNDGQVVTASGTKLVNNGIPNIQKPTSEFWSPNEVFNNKNRNTMKWLVCDSGAKLNEFEDGTGYRAIDLEDAEYERGWWSAVKSDGSGNFSTPQWVESTFNARKINQIVLFTTEHYANMKTVEVSYRVGASWTSLGVVTLAINEFKRTWDLPAAPSVNGLRATVYSTYGGGEFARLSEIQGYYSQDISDDIVTLDIGETRNEYETSVPVGASAANTLSFTLDNTHGRYNLSNTASDVQFYLGANNRVTVDWGINVNFDTGTDSGSPGGGSTGLTWNVTDGTKMWIWNVGSVSGRDDSIPPPANGYPTAWVDTGFSDGTILAQVDPIQETNSPGFRNGVIFRYIDANNFWVWTNYRSPVSGLQYWLQCFSGGVSVYSTAGMTAGVRDTGTPIPMEVVLDGPLIKCYYDGVLRHTVTNATHQTATKHGVETFGYGVNYFSATNEAGTTVISDDFATGWPLPSSNTSIHGRALTTIVAPTAPAEWIYQSAGEFWTDEWSNDSGSMIASVSARDFSKFIQDEISDIPRVWTKTKISAVIYDLMARHGFGLERINIDVMASREFGILFLKDNSIWTFLEEVALADQSSFGFDRNGNFYYHNYDRLNRAPYNSSVYNFSWDTNIESGSVPTALYANKVVVKVSPFSIENTGRRAIWSVSENTNLTWARLGAAITSSATTIPVIAAPNQTTGNLTTNNWNQSGYLWLPIVTNGKVVGGEVVKYNSRTDSAFTECERGYANTTATQHPLNRHIGEVNIFDIEFDNAPALKVQYPFVTAIDVLKIASGEGEVQAHILLWEYNAFGGKLIIGNLVPWYTFLSGTEASYKDRIDGNTDINDDALINWATAVAGWVAIEKTGKEEVGKEVETTQLNADYIRRYGKNELSIDSPWIQTKEHAEQISRLIVDEYKVPRRILQIEGVGYPPLELSDRVTVSNFPQLSIVNEQYHIIGIDLSYDGGLRGSYTLRKVKS